MNAEGHMGESASVEQPDVMVLKVWRGSSLLTYVPITFVLLVVAVAIAVGGGSPAVFLLPTACLALWLLTGLTLRKQWEHWTFRLTRETLEMNSGWIWRKTRIVARDRIQHVDINSGPLDRRFGLVQVVVHTAGTAVGVIPGLRPERAERLREELMMGPG